MKIKLIILLPLTCMVLLSCEKIINLDHLRPEPKIVLNSVAVVGQPVSAYITRTWFHTNSKKNVSIHNAEVKLYVNDIFREQMQFIASDTVLNADEYYRSIFVPSPSEKLTIVASATGFEDVQATTQLPPSASISVSDVSLLENKTIIYENDTVRIYECKSSFKFTIHDDPSAENYYLIYVDEQAYDYSESNPTDTVLYWRPIDLDFSAEPLFSNQVTAFDKFFGHDEEPSIWRMAFSDELIDGKSYTITLPIGSYSQYLYEYINEPALRLRKYRLHLLSISSDYYHYLKMLQDMRRSSFVGDLSNIGFSEPIRVYSNVKGGAGVLGGSCPFYWELTGNM